MDSHLLQTQEIAELKLLVKQLTSQLTKLEMVVKQAEKSKTTTPQIKSTSTAPRYRYYTY